MLPTDLIKKIKRLHVVSGKAVDTVMAGRYKSAFRGSGMEFEEVREYVPGDEIKSIDWRVTARMGRPYVKRYREERELVIMLLVDMSGSGEFGGQDRLKRDAAVEAAAVLAFNAIRNNDKVGAVLFTDQVERYVPPKKGSGHVWRVIKEIVSHQPQSKGTDIGQAVDYVSRISRKKTVCFCISDYIDEGFAPAFKRAARRHDMVAALVMDPKDFELPRAGLLAGQDLETGLPLWIDCSSAASRQAYSQAMQARREASLEALKSAGVDVVQLATNESAADALVRFFKARERKRVR